MQPLWRMRLIAISIFLAICLAGGVAQNTQDLPSAPSAVMHQKNAPPKPAAAPVQPPQTQAVPPTDTEPPSPSDATETKKPPTKHNPQTADTHAHTNPAS